MRSLTTKILSGLLIILVGLGVVFFLLAKWSSDRYHQEVTQRLNATIAQYIVAEDTLLAGDQINSAALESIAHMAMVINPVAEVYLLDASGRILAHAIPAQEVHATHVATEPLRKYLQQDARLPIFGDDPRNRGEQKVFSVATIEDAGQHVGYVYVVLGGQKYLSEAARVLDSHVLRVSAAGSAVIVLFSILASLVMVWVLTRRLRQLVGGMEKFEASGFREQIQLPQSGDNGDEIDRLIDNFNTMSSTIVDQINRLRQTDQSRRELIANVSHDLRTPIASMKGYLDTLIIKHDSLSIKDRQRYLEVASNHSAYLGKLIEDLFELSCLDSGLIKPKTEVFSLSELVQDVAQKYQLQAAQARVSLEPKVDAGVALVDADIGMIQQVLENLIGNALKHTPPQGRILVTVTPEDYGVCTTITDTGHGIPSEELPFIFNRAYTGGNSASDRRANAGLGLAIVKRILDLHHSQINVTSKVGNGSAFRFELAVASLDAA